MTATSGDDDPLALLHTLVAIPSVNRRLAPDATGETALAQFCSRWLGQRGFHVEWLEAQSGSPTLVAYAVGTGGGRTILLNGHLDTVGVASFEGDPFRAVVDDGKIYGRGTFDMKGSLAAMLVAATRATGSATAADDKRSSLRGTVVLTLVADEEFGSVGTEEALRFLASRRDLHADGAIVLEPSSLELTLAHRGFAWFELEMVGRAAHGSQPELGVDAIAGASALLPALDSWAKSLATGPLHERLGSGTVRVATIAGGVDAATVAPSCTITIERRTLPGEDAATVEKDLRTVIHHALAPISELTWDLTRLVVRPAFEANPHSEIVSAVRSAAEAHQGRPPADRAEPFWTDAALVADAGIPCLVYGVDGGGAHSDREWVTADSVVALTTILDTTIRDFCG
jgi:succinyl-diaminopimelate desuccinylase